MQLTRFTDYSIRVLIYLGLRQDQWTTIREISDAYQISRNHLMKVVSFLANRGYIASQRGPGGGIRLNRTPPAINLADVVREAEGNLQLMDCLRDETDFVLNPACCLKEVFANALQAFLATLDQHSLQDLIEPQDELSRLLGIPA